MNDLIIHNKDEHRIIQTITLIDLRKNLLSPKVDLKKNKIIILNKFLQGFNENTIKPLKFLNFNSIFKKSYEDKNIKSKIDNQQKIIKNNKDENRKINNNTEIIVSKKLDEIDIFLNDVLNLKNSSLLNLLKL